MHYFVAEIRQQEIGSVIAFSRRAENLYDENLNAYVKIVLRRPFYKIIVSDSAAFSFPLVSTDSNSSHLY